MKNCVPLVFLLLAGLSSSADADPRDPVSKRTPLSDAERYSRPITDENPFGIDYGIHPYSGNMTAQGVPTRSLSMYHAQIIFAGKKCVSSDVPARRQRGFQAVMLWNHDKDLDKAYKLAYAKAVERMVSNYQHAWEAMDESRRSQYCTDYWTDLDFRGKFQAPFINAAFGPNTAVLSQFYLAALSPFSRESIEEFERNAKAKEELDKRLGVALLIGQVIVAAAGISAANDSLAAQKSGNYAMAQMRHAQSRSLLAFSEGIATTVQASTSTNSQTTPFQESQQDSCQALDHFAQHDAEPDSDVWKRYQSLSSGCEALNRVRVE